ncbi:MAG: aspartate dehydrogenase [Candidatus Omnitrophica bacterium]|nr:aspartate dehydrogenase [Candidatus Omnitrophota bacterium]
MTKRLKVGIVGCGTIGTVLAKACRGRLKNKVELVGLYDTDSEKAQKLAAAIGKRIAQKTVHDLFTKAGLVIEAAAGAVSGRLLDQAIRHKKDIMIMSVGGIIGNEGLLKRAAARGIRVYFPSGALAGIDALKSAALGGITSVCLTTRKPPQGLEGAEYIKAHHINLKGLKRQTEVFSGTAAEAVRAFPQNINVSALLSLAGIGAVRTKVRIVADPAIDRNIHEVEIRSKSGVVRTMTENVPSPANPKTSFLAALSAVATVEGIVNTVRYGT